MKATKEKMTVILKTKTKVWDRWRKMFPSSPDLRYANLRYANLREANLCDEIINETLAEIAGWIVDECKEGRR